MVRFAPPPPQQNLPSADNTTFALVRDLLGNPDDAAATTPTDRKTVAARLRGALVKLATLQASVDAGATGSDATTIIGKLDIIDDFLDTEIAAILALLDTEITTLLQRALPATSLGTESGLAATSVYQTILDVTGAGFVSFFRLEKMNAEVAYIKVTRDGVVRYYKHDGGAGNVRHVRGEPLGTTEGGGSGLTTTEMPCYFTFRTGLKIEMRYASVSDALYPTLYGMYAA